MLLVAKYSDTRRERKPLVIGTLVVSVSGLVVTSTFRDTPWLGVAGLVLLAIGVFSYLGPFWALASESLTRAQTAVGLSAINAIAAAGGFFGPFVIGRTAAADDVIIGLMFPAVSMTIGIVLLALFKPGIATSATNPERRVTSTEEPA